MRINLLFVFCLMLMLFPKVSLSQGITSTNLPLVIINTNGQVILDASKVSGTMKLIYNGAGKLNLPTDIGNIYNGNIGIEYQGGSKLAQQNSYGFETRDVTGANRNVSLLGMPEENDWILLANYNDKSFVRNALAFQLFRKMGHYAPRTQTVEVVVNNEYMGIYTLTEKIKQDVGRVDISKLKSTDISGDNLTGGYIFKIDTYDDTNSWQSNFSVYNHPEQTVHYVFDDPSAADLVTPQINYLKSTVSSFETVLYGSGFANPTTGYPAWIKMNSFLDFFIVSEVSRNMNAYRKNAYYFKNKDSKDNKIHSGPVWDFDVAFKNLVDDCTAYSATDGSGWAYKINDCAGLKTSSNGWIVRLLEDPAFKNALYNRYTLMRTTYISNNYMNNFIDSVKNLVSEAQVRHYDKWKILSTNAGPDEVDVQPSTYQGHVDKLKSWIQTRLNWLDINIPGNPSGVRAIDSKFSCRVYPNPASSVVYLESSSQISEYKIFRIDGVCVVARDGLSTYSADLNISALKSGIYLVQIKTKDSHIFNSRFAVR